MDPIDRLAGLRRRPERLLLGLMSGMSADGLDLALVRVRDRPVGLDVSLLAHATRPYPAALSGRIRAATSGPTREVMCLGQALAERWAGDVLAFLEAAGVPPAAVDVIGSHGQTLDHVGRGPGRPAATLQVGDGDVLAERTGILVVSDLRPRDVAAGGEGAPLVPYADWVLHARPGAVVAAQNLGSIANVTVVPERLEDVLAFDAGPANALVDAFAREVPGDHGGIDLDGRISAAGRPDAGLLAWLEAARRPFLERPPPRSAGYEDFGPALAAAARAAHPDVTPADRVASAVAWTAGTLAGAYARFVRPRFPALREVHVSGGGARNPTLLAAIRRELAALDLAVHPLPDDWIDAKEAVAFALLADATVRGVPANVPGATGARHRVLLGKISLGAAG